MKKIVATLLSALAMMTACGQKSANDTDVKQFAGLVADSSVVVLDVRTAEEFAEGHIARAINIDVKDDNFLSNAKRQLPQDKTIAVYCRSGRRSAKACGLLEKEGFKVYNLLGGIMAWQAEEMPVEQ